MPEGENRCAKMFSFAGYFLSRRPSPATENGKKSRLGPASRRASETATHGSRSFGGWQAPGAVLRGCPRGLSYNDFAHHSARSDHLSRPRRRFPFHARPIPACDSALLGRRGGLFPTHISAQCLGPVRHRRHAARWLCRAGRACGYAGAALARAHVSRQTARGPRDDLSLPPTFGLAVSGCFKP